MSELKNVRRGATLQTEKAKAGQVKNSAGGFVFKVDKWGRLERFLILGSESPTYYASARELTKQNVTVVEECVASDVRKTVDVIVAISDGGRAPKNSPALFALAVALTDAADADKAYVRAAVNKVARTGTHLFEFAQYVENLGGWGRSKRKALAGWYEAKDADQLAYQAVKYRQRNGWTHRDVMRLAHPQGVDARVGNFILGKEVSEDAPNVILGFRAVQAAKSADEVARIVSEYRLPWETIPTEFLRDKKVWAALFDAKAVPLGATLRNIKRLDEIGYFNDLKRVADVAARLRNADEIKKARLHPLNFLVAQAVYSGEADVYSGYGYRRQTVAKGNAKILGAMEDGFYAAFGAVEPAGKRTLIGLDISGSMGWGTVANMPGITPAKGAAAMSMVTLRTEPYAMVRGFSTQFIDLGLSDKDTLNSVMQKTANRNFGGTDCALPMTWALKNKVDIDTFIVYTDNETWAGNKHPYQALNEYRQKTGINAKLIVVGMTATGFSIADPSDAGMLDVVGFDTAAPAVMADFSRN